MKWYSSYWWHMGQKPCLLWLIWAIFLYSWAMNTVITAASSSFIFQLFYVLWHIARNWIDERVINERNVVIKYSGTVMKTCFILTEYRIFCWAFNGHYLLRSVWNDKQVCFVTYTCETVLFWILIVTQWLFDSLYVASVSKR